MLLEKKVPRPVYLLMGICLFVALVVGAFFEEGVAFFNPDYTSKMTDLEYYLSLAVVIIVVGSFLFLAHRFFKIKINIPFLVIASVLFIGNMVAVLSFPESSSWTHFGSGSEIEYVLTGANRARYILTMGVTSLYLYILFAVVPKVFRSSKQINFYFLAIIIACIVAILWSYVQEQGIYGLYFDPNGEIDSSKVVKSFFNNRNTYGMFLLFGIMACGYLQFQSRHWWLYLLMAFFFANMFFVLSKTSLILAFVFVPCYLVFRFVVTVKRHPVKDIITTVILLSLLGLAIWFFTSGKVSEIPFFDKIWRNFLEAIQQREHDTLDSRAEEWQHVLYIVTTNPLYIIFGCGQGNFMVLFGLVDPSTSFGLGFTHDGLLAMFAYGGIIRLVIYIAMIAYFFVLVIYNLSRKHLKTVVSLLMMLIIIGHGLVETTSFLDADSKSILIIVMVYLPVLLDYYNDTHPEKVQWQIAQASSYQKKRVVYSFSDLEAGKIWALFGFLALFIVAGLSPLFVQFQSPWVLSGAFLTAFISPLFGIVVNRAFHSKRKVVAYFLLFGLLLISAGSLLLPFFWNSYGALIVSGVVCFLSLILALVFTSHGRDQSAKRIWLEAYLPYSILFIAVITFTGLLSLLGMEVTPYARVAATSLALLPFFFLTIASPLSPRLIYPLDCFWERIEDYCLCMAIQHDQKQTWKNARYMMKKKRHKKVRQQIQPNSY